MFVERFEASRRYGLRLLGHTAREVSDLSIPTAYIDLRLREQYSYFSFGDVFKITLRILLQCRGAVLDENRKSS